MNYSIIGYIAFGLLIGWLTKLPFLLKFYKQAKCRERHADEVLENAKKVLKRVEQEKRDIEKLKRESDPMFKYQIPDYKNVLVSLIAVLDNKIVVNSSYFTKGDVIGNYIPKKEEIEPICVITDTGLPYEIITEDGKGCKGFIYSFEYLPKELPWEKQRLDRLLIKCYNILVESRPGINGSTFKLRFDKDWPH